MKCINDAGIDKASNSLRSEGEAVSTTKMLVPLKWKASARRTRIGQHRHGERTAAEQHGGWVCSAAVSPDIKSAGPAASSLAQTYTCCHRCCTISCLSASGKPHSCLSEWLMRDGGWSLWSEESHLMSRQGCRNVKTFKKKKNPVLI